MSREGCDRCGRPVEGVRVAGTDDVVVVDARTVWVRAGQDPPGRLWRPVRRGVVEAVTGAVMATSSVGRRDRAPARGPYRVSHSDTCGT